MVGGGTMAGSITCPSSENDPHLFLLEKKV
jgi:hypothetical protein